MSSTTDRPAPLRGAGRAAALLTAPAAMLAVLRVLSSYSWLSGAVSGQDAKLRAHFLSGQGLVERVEQGQHAFVRTAEFGWVSRLLPGLVEQHGALLAWLLALGELGVGLSLLLGLLTRLGGLFAIAQAVVQWLAAGGSGADAVGHNYLLAVAGLVVLVTGAGRVAGLDGLLRRRRPGSRLLRVVT